MVAMITRARLDEAPDMPDGPKSERCARGLRILVVEDDADTAESMATLLRCWGHQAAVVRNGFEAVKVVEADCPDLVLLDLAMPGMDGFQVARRLRQLLLPDRKIPFLIAVSGYGDKQSCQESHEAGIDLHLVKPVDLPALQALLNRFERVVMPGAEQRTSWLTGRVPFVPTLRHCSERAMLKRCVALAAELRQRETETRSKFHAAVSRHERAAVRKEWCTHIARYLDEAEKITRLLASFQRWGIHS